MLQVGITLFHMSLLAAMENAFFSMVIVERFKFEFFISKCGRISPCHKLNSLNGTRPRPIIFSYYNIQRINLEFLLDLGRNTVRVPNGTDSVTMFKCIPCWAESKTSFFTLRTITAILPNLATMAVKSSTQEWN